jgi:hypothetical protein
MRLNIKNSEARQLAEAIAKDTGENLTQVVITALRERLKSLKVKKSRASAAELIRIAERTSSLLRSKNGDDVDFLYDERGMPK